ncbi:hypothetical protein [Mycobacterium nebraskense]|uniref:Uncharacterized protein n=1 Tax=Mycobacterium nebraskense TaxID=244292 RepID=A0A1X1YWE6_9MYCO|nr:hypothetical protein [Mycobacterium nebraskense]KLO42703.1 hypothetical protein ABW17_11615 [Mycobacterium nebraskense]MBI2694021.1 hypothetical protein [Mycobacterium nebraskense]MCV7119237.1 hypothetical protein [Mycobacterium nebraskense]ORW15415.1 hypothetical protein AWC17_18540 [Mycobacterium nebraskense]
MRFVAAVLRAVLWLATTVALAVAIPAVWLQCNVVSEGGYAALAQKAAGDPALQSAAADELTNRAMALIAAHNAGGRPVDSAELHEAAAAFTAGPAFPALFAQANRAAHRWLFATGGAGESWEIDVAPMLKDASLQRILTSHNVKVPATLNVPLTASAPSTHGSLRQGRLSPLATWGPWVSIGAVALSVVCAVLTLGVARRRGKALTSLGVSALLVGAGGWAGIEIARRYVNDGLNRTTGDIRRIAEVMVGHAEASLHQWLNLTLLAGAALAIAGVLVAMLGSLRKKPAG